MFKSEQDELVDESTVFELGGTLSLTIPEVTFQGYNATPSLNLTHMRFFNAKLADILDFETQVVAASMGLQISDSLTITPGLDYNRMISPGGTEHKFHGSGASLMAMKMIPHGEKGMLMIMGGGKWNWTHGDALLDPITGIPIVEVDPVTGRWSSLRTEDEQDRWDANIIQLHTAYLLASFSVPLLELQSATTLQIGVRVVVMLPTLLEPISACLFLSVEYPSIRHLQL